MTWWTETWVLEDDRSRLYCGIAQTPEGFAVDVFDGDTCVESDIYTSREEAEREALARKTYYGFTRYQSRTTH